MMIKRNGRGQSKTKSVRWGEVGSCRLKQSGWAIPEFREGAEPQAPLGKGLQAEGTSSVKP